MAPKIRPLRRYTACNPSGGSNNNDPSADTVVDQSESVYNAAGSTILSIRWQRFHDATGSGALNGPSGSQPRAIRQYSCWWQDAIGREIASADYGTNGGAVLVRPEVPPSTSEEVLVSRTRHASTGETGAVIDPMGTETRWKRDALGREIETIENFKESAPPAADVNRTTRFAYHPSGGLETLTLVNDVTGDQTTRWVYGTTLIESGVATGHLLRAKIYPESDDSAAPLGNGPDGIYERTEHTYNRQGEVVTTKDPNETVHAYDRDKMGRLLHDRITAFGSGIDQSVKRISIVYETKRLLTSKVSSYDHATPGSGTVLNEVSYAYDGLGQQTKDRQAHGGAVVPGTTPEVTYTYATP
jgi:YD repeat-containing protein